MKPSRIPILIVALIVAALGAALPSCSHAPDPQPSLTPPPSITEAQPRPLTMSEFIFGPGDELQVSVWRQKDFDSDCRVSPLGTIAIPLVGNIKAAGRSLPDVQNEITLALAKYYNEPRVTVAVKTLRSMKVYVLGEVERPGIFALDEPINVLQAISMAGGFNRDAKRESVLLIRGSLSNPALRKLNLEAALDRANFGDNTEIVRGDILYVPATPIANAQRFFQRLRDFLTPIVEAERALILLPQIPGSYGPETKDKTVTKIIVTP
jgi:polysaccharide export outer membrane protein